MPYESYKRLRMVVKILTIIKVTTGNKGNDKSYKEAIIECNELIKQYEEETKYKESEEDDEVDASRRDLRIL